MTRQFSLRAQSLMKTLVEQYLREGQPVASKTLAEMSHLGISPATVRNVMMELEDLGLVTTPHTSAGKVPTALGYRLFVDHLLTIQPLAEPDVSRIRAQLKPELDTASLLNQASNLLSEVTHMAGLVRVPRRQVQTLKALEFLPIGHQRVLAVLVLSDREVQNRILFCDRDYTRDELQQAANYVNQHFAGRDLREARNDLLTAMQADRHLADSMMSKLMRVAEAALQGNEPQDDFHLSGELNLLQLAGGGDVAALREVMEAFGRKQQILGILDKCLSADSVQVFIGQEAGQPGLESVSLVGAPYTVNGDRVGVLAVVGPTRMAYDRVIPVVDITARLLGSALSVEE